MSIYGLSVFLVAYMLAVASPGPGVAAIVARALGYGLRGAPAFIAGFLVGDLVWFALAATGLAMLAQTAYTVFVVVNRMVNSGAPGVCTATMMPQKPPSNV